MTSFIPWLMLAAGIIAGWLLAWLLGRGGRKEHEQQVDRLQADLAARDKDLAAANSRISSLQSASNAQIKALQIDSNNRIKGLETQLQASSADLAAAQAQLAGVRSDSEVRVASLEAEFAAAKSDWDARSASLKAELSATAEHSQSRIARLEAQLSGCNGELAQARSQLSAARASTAATAERGAGIDLGTALEAEPAENGAAAPAASATAHGGAVEPAPPPDDLTKIRGIGPAFAARLSSVGIRRYADVAAATPDELLQAAGVQDWQKVDTTEWIAEARLLATRPRQIQIGDDLTCLEGIGPAYAARLRAAGITTFAELAAADEARLAEIVAAPGWRKVAYDDWIEQARLAAAGDDAGLQALQDRLFSRRGDNLALIEGVGEQTAQALAAAGISSFAALAGATSDQVVGALGAAGMRAGNVDGWIAEAKLRAAGKRVKRATSRPRALSAATERACPQDLEMVKGIGRVYEQRLYAAGVGAYWELAMLSDGELTDILEVRDFQDVDLAAIKADAMRLARETHTMGQMWDGSEPDDFDVLEGIGAVLERRLYAAGICTFAALAATTEERLAEICQAPSFNRPNYARWIEQARERISGK